MHGKVRPLWRSLSFSLLFVGVCCSIDLIEFVWVWVSLSQVELLDLCLVAKLAVNKPIHLSTIEERLCPLWQPGRQMDLIPMENNKFMVQLFHKGDLERILEGSPWLLDNNMIILKKFMVGEDLIAIPMNSTEIWVHIHQLPFGRVEYSSCWPWWHGLPILLCRAFD